MINHNKTDYMHSKLMADRQFILTFRPDELTIDALVLMGFLDEKTLRLKNVKRARYSRCFGQKNFSKFLNYLIFREYTMNSQFLNEKSDFAYYRLYLTNTKRRREEFLIRSRSELARLDAEIKAYEQLLENKSKEVAPDKTGVSKNGETTP